jgi:prepilin-type N-terminal cleavage/methylation domain-containing protein
MITTTPSRQERTGVVAAQRGFTLVELLVALLVSGVTLAAAVLVTTQVSRGYTTQIDDALVQEEARFALEWIEELVRVAGSNPYGVTTSNCPAAGTVFQAVWIDPNGDAVLDDIRLQADLGPPNAQLGGAGGVCTEADEDITIAYDAVARTITRLDNNLGGPPTAMTEGLITQLAFTTLDSNRVPTGVAAAVAFVQVAVTAESPDANPRTGQKATLTLSSEVRVRSR